MCETFVNRSCCKTETLLRRTYTFDLVYFLYASLLCISKEKTVWGTLLQTNTFLQTSDKKSTSPILTQIKILGIYEKQRIKLDIFVNFVKKKQFSRFQTNNDFFLFHFSSLKDCNILSQILHLLFQVALWNQPTVVLPYWKWYWTGTFKPYFTPCSVSFCFQ